MLDVESLSSLDLLLWLGRGQDAGLRLSVNQSTVSRKANASARVFDLCLKHYGDDWDLIGNTELLRLERHVHQLHRFHCGTGLRMDADPWLGPILVDPAPLPGWIKGRYHHLGHHKPQRLLQERVIDGWLTVLKPELVQAQSAHLHIMDLGALPMELLAARNHPLASEEHLELSDLFQFERLNLPSGVTPWFEAALRNRGLWDTSVDARQYCSDDWEGRACEHQALLYGHCLTRELNGSLVPLDFNLQIQLTIALVVHKAFAEHPLIHSALDGLRQQLEPITAHHPDLELVA